MSTKVVLFNKAKYANVLSLVITHNETNTSSLTLLQPGDSTYYYLDGHRTIRVKQHIPGLNIIPLMVRVPELAGLGPGVVIKNDILETAVRRGDEMDVLVEYATELVIKEE